MTALKTMVDEKSYTEKMKYSRTSLIKKLINYDIAEGRRRKNRQQIMTMNNNDEHA